uniref:Ac1254 n=1 Tax=Rattus norvegicus TaxID=10116 RepID=Q7TQ80_RAT|nr:Ac1254 [Rattus norvegicus]|eukprot:NP_001008877.1 Ac1254 [Rattus norvegicus]
MKAAQRLGLLAAEDCWSTAGLQCMLEGQQASSGGHKQQQQPRGAGELVTDQLSYRPGPGPGFELTNPNIYPIYDLLDCVKGPVLQIQICRISTTQGNNIISERSPTPYNLLNGNDDGGADGADDGGSDGADGDGDGGGGDSDGLMGETGWAASLRGLAALCISSTGCDAQCHTRAPPHGLSRAKLQFQEENHKVHLSKHPMATPPTLPLSNSQSGYNSRVKGGGILFFHGPRYSAVLAIGLKQGQGGYMNTEQSQQGREETAAPKQMSLALSPDIRLSDMPKFFWSLGCWEEHSACFAGCFANADDRSGALALVWFLRLGSGTAE